MMNEFQILKNAKFGSIRTIEINGVVWFLGKDVTKILGYIDSCSAIRNHVDTEDKLTKRVFLSGQNRKAVFINKNGLYSIISSSKLSLAKDFRRWIDSEVLPSICKSEKCISNIDLAKQILTPDFMISILTDLKSERNKNELLSQENLTMKAKATYFDEFYRRRRNINLGIREASMILGVPQNIFVQYLKKNKYIEYVDSQIVPTQKGIKSAFVESIPVISKNSNKWSGFQTLITPKGLVAFSKSFENNISEIEINESERLKKESRIRNKKILKLFASGESENQISKEIGCPINVVKSVIRNDKTNSCKLEKDELYDWIRDLYEVGREKKKIAEVLGVSIYTVNKAIK